MKIFLSLSISLTLFLFSCGNTQTEKASVQKDTLTHEEHHTEAASPIELNQGAKWKVDSNMMVYIHQMESDISTFVAKETKDYSALGKKLEANIDLLTSNCTMTGKPHDELHKWLLPYIELVKGFSATKSNTEAASQLEKIQHSMETFHLYFE